MHRPNQYKQAPKPSKKPLIDLSSDSDSYEDQKQNRCEESTHTTHTLPYKSNPLQQHVNAQRYSNQLQFSTLNLDQNSLQDMDHQLKILKSEKKELMRENEILRSENYHLKELLQSAGDGEESKQKLEECYIRIDQLTTKYHKLQEQYRKAEKDFKNILTNKQLPNKKSITEQNNRIYKEVADKIKQICSRFIQDLSKQKMSSKVQDLISDYLQQIVQVNPRTNDSNIFAQYKSNKSINAPRHSKVCSEHNSLNISSDYKLLEKSIDKLKNMEKEIDVSSGSYLKKAYEPDSSVYMSNALAHSAISTLDKSKSKRKRIFQ